MRECDKDKGKTIAILQGTPEEFREWLGAPKNILMDNLSKTY